MKYFIIPPMEPSHIFFTFAAVADGLFLLAQELKQADLDMLDAISQLPVPKMLDNGVYEKQQLDFENVLELAECVRADYVILPDDPWGSPDHSLRRQLEAYDDYRHEIFQFIGVPHGHNFVQYWDQCNALARRVGFLGMSIITVWKRRGGMRRTRPYWVHLVAKAFPDVKMHLLGLDQPAELFCVKHIENVVSFDTTLPLTYAYRDRVLPFFCMERVERMPVKWSKRLTHSRLALALHNINKLREWARSGSDTY